MGVGLLANLFTTGVSWECKRKPIWKRSNLPQEIIWRLKNKIKETFHLQKAR